MDLNAPPTKEELEKYSKAAATGIDAPPTKEELEKYSEKEPGLLSKAGTSVLSGLSTFGKAESEYGGANAVRAAIGELEKSGSLPSALSVGRQAYGNSSVPVPSGEELIAGAPLVGGYLKEKMAKHPVLAKGAGLITEIATDPVTYTGGVVGRLGKIGEVASDLGSAAKKGLIGLTSEAKAAPAVAEAAYSPSKIKMAFDPVKKSYSVVPYSPLAKTVSKEALPIAEAAETPLDAILKAGTAYTIGKSTGVPFAGEIAAALSSKTGRQAIKNTAKGAKNAWNKIPDKVKTGGFLSAKALEKKERSESGQ